MINEELLYLRLRDFDITGFYLLINISLLLLGRRLLSIIH